MKKKVNILIFAIIVLLLGLGIGFASSITINSSDVLFDNNGTELSSNNLQDAINELNSKTINEYNRGYEEGISNVSSETVFKVINSVYNAQTSTDSYSGISCSSMGSGAYQGDEDTVTATRTVPVYKESDGLYYILSSLTASFDLHNGGWYWSASNSGSGSASASISMTAYDKEGNSLGSLGNLSGVYSFFEHNTPDGMDYINLGLYVHTSIGRECDDGPYARINTIIATYLAVDLK